MERKECINQINSVIDKGFNREKIASIIDAYYQGSIDADSMKEEILEILELLDETRAILYDRDISEIVGCNLQYAKHIRLDRKNEHERTYFEVSETIPQTLKYEVLERDNQQCVFCGKKEDLVIHHIIPVSKDGETEKDNLATLCKDCHLEAHGGSYTNSLHSMPYRTISGFWNLVQEKTNAV